MALYQLFWLSRIPDHAAVHETVELAKLKGFGPQAGFVNAVLRGYLRDREETSMLLERLKRDDLAVGYSHPDWLVKKWVARYGKEETTRLLTWNNTPPKVFARINTLKISPDELKEVWKKEGVEFTAVEWPWTTFPMVEFQGVSAVEQLESFKKGFFYIQDPSTLLSVEYLEPKEGDSILDLCAAPGGKCTLIAQRMGDKGAVTAEDLAPSRIQLIEENVRRLGLNCVTARLSDGVPSGEQYDRVLVDAPCSNAGVFRRRVELRWRISPSEVERLRAVQLKLLKSAIAKVKPGGCLVYSTCSLEPEENEGVVTEALIEHPEMIVEKQRQLLPFADLVDGAFVAQMRKAK
jgi:16S rRNA (cytosine967-C5)-methyltransferase